MSRVGVVDDDGDANGATVAESRCRRATAPLLGLVSMVPGDPSLGAILTYILINSLYNNRKLRAD